MKVAVSAVGPGLDAAVDERFGRCAYFQFIDTETMASEAVPNTAAESGSGVGVQVAQMLADRGVGAVVTGNCGPKAFATLHAAVVPVYTGAAGTVAEAVAALNRGELRSADGPTGPAHHGMGGR
ncbi:MAG: NifB/NifX family molybdenum-iron cluster-binding protein [bacterium]